MSVNYRDRFRACLLGGAVGDALGAAVEFDEREFILERFGPNGITDYAPAYGGIGRITDDTQMTLFTADGLLRCWVRRRMDGLPGYADSLADAYLRWLCTQDCRMRIPAESAGWLFRHKELFNSRAPGGTCVSALNAMRTPGKPARNDSKGCGGVMRVAPVGLFCWRVQKRDAIYDAFRIGCDASALTHGHPSGILPGGAFALLIQSLLEGKALREAIMTAKERLQHEPDHGETFAAVELAKK